MKTSEAINELATALAKAQGSFSNPERNRTVTVQTKTGGKYTFDYATLDAILEMARPHLSTNGLALIQPVTIEGEWVLVTTRLMHGSGQWIEESLAMKPEDMSPQKVGSAATYGRRYGLISLLGIASEEDDDGNHASGNSVDRSVPRAATRPVNGNGKHSDPPTDIQSTMRDSPQFAEFSKWLVATFPDASAAWTEAYSAARNLTHTPSSIRVCVNPETFKAIRDVMQARVKLAAVK